MCATSWGCHEVTNDAMIALRRDGSYRITRFERYETRYAGGIALSALICDSGLYFCFCTKLVGQAQYVPRLSNSYATTESIILFRFRTIQMYLTRRACSGEFAGNARCLSLDRDLA